MDKLQKQVFRILLRMAEKRNVCVDINSPLPKRVNGLWFLDEKHYEYILLNGQLQDQDFKNFVFAHELGHSVLHKGKINNALYQENNWNSEYQKAIEAEAGEFARNLLEKLVRVVL
ncbi:hypothetical protein SDC9_210791 [bioreactor metagenome]|uniref:IrrE N-terminal-like domain-containing protein n=1 Tax=bioreactor metagenome TaxID=1076179 RepID=A0A645JI65_9ZZZZ